MFTHFPAKSVRHTHFDVKWGVKCLLLPQDIEHKISRYYFNFVRLNGKRDIHAAKTRRNNHLKTPYNTTFSLHFVLSSEQLPLNSVNYVKNAILENNFEQLYRYCT